MEQVLYKVHVRLLTTTSRYVNYGCRRAVEAITLLGAIALTFILIALHRTFVTHSSLVDTNCILKLLQDTNLFNSSSSSINISQLMRKFDLVAITVSDPYDVYYRQLKRDKNISSPRWKSFPPSYIPLQDSYTTGDDKMISDKVLYSIFPSSMENQTGGVRQYIAGSKDLNVRWGSFRYLFALQRGTLMLTQERESPYHRNFTVLDVTITPEMSCLSQKKMRTILARWTNSFDVVVMNWAISAFEGSGYLYNTVSHELFNLNYAADFEAKKGTEMGDMGRRESYTNNSNYLISAWRWLKKNVLKPMINLVSARLAEYIEVIGLWTHLEELLSSVIGNPSMFFLRITAFSTENGADAYSLMKLVYQYFAFRIGVLFSTSFLFFTSTTLINYILRETQERMLRFTFLLQYHITHRMPFMLLVFTHVIGSLVFVPILMGIYFFLFEFFSDQLLAFLVLLVVWMGEVFSVLSLRSDINIKYFPKIFACYFFLFHVYFFSFPFGFCYVALSATVCYVLHAMIHFWNVYEVPAFESGRISPVRPRMSSGPPLSDSVDRSRQVAATATANNSSFTTNSIAISSRIRSSSVQIISSNAISSNPSANSAGTLGDSSRRPRSNSSNSGKLPPEFLAAVPHTPLAAATSNPLSTQLLQQAFVQSQQQQMARQRQLSNIHQFPLNKFPLRSCDLSPLQPKRQRSYTDPSLEDSSAVKTVLSMLSKFSPSQLLSTSENREKEKRKISSDEQRNDTGDSYFEEKNPDSDLSASALFFEETDKKFFVLSNTRPRKNSAPTPPRQVADDTTATSNFKSDRFLRFYPQSNNRSSQFARKEELSGIGSNLEEAQTNTPARRGRADSMSSNNSSGSQNKKKVSANIYETVEARRLRLDRNFRIDQEELEQEQWGSEEIVDSIVYDLQSPGDQVSKNDSGLINNCNIQMSASSNDGDDFTYIFYDEDEASSPKISSTASSASKDLKSTQLNKTAISESTAERKRGASASDAVSSPSNVRRKFSIFGNDLDEDD